MKEVTVIGEDSNLDKVLSEFGLVGKKCQLCGKTLSLLNKSGFCEHHRHKGLATRRRNDLEFRARQNELQRQRYRTDGEYRRKLLERCAERYRTDEVFRNRQLELARARHQKRKHQSASTV